MLVSEFCNRQVVIIDQEATILDAAKLMRVEHVGDLVVVDNRHERQVPIGILTDRDIVVRVVAEEIDLDRISVGDAMSYELHSINEQFGLQETLEKMRHHGVRRLPVVDAEGALVGIITSDDLTELIAEQLNNLVLLVGNELAGERARRG
ncbi:CBS domain-containing protein [Geopsychrobacter electrodiphilus]|uniref:CBS domain-containing protein n=1 Tax=Geopsychrobacter electrodiphilus TaxID=225196 RepID=UPI000361CA74|nr:CBS domain-containing protein [Geopsychrobacter electrodiphilus]